MLILMFNTGIIGSPLLTMCSCMYPALRQHSGVVAIELHTTDGAHVGLLKRLTCIIILSRVLLTMEGYNQPWEQPFMISCGGHNYAYLQSIERGGASSWNDIMSFNAQYRPQSTV